MTISLAVCNKLRNLQMVLVGQCFNDMMGLPHVLKSDVASLSHLLARSEVEPRVVILIDDLAEVNSGLGRLLQDGHKSGIHIVASGNVSSAGFTTVLRGNGDRGDFTAQVGSDSIRFQCAHISPAEVDQTVAQSLSAPRRWDVGGRPSLLRQAVGLVAGAV
jgi:hypothetical protein